MKKKILVVDDDTQQKSLYMEVFQVKGFEVSSASDGLEGLETALKQRPDLVFTGIIMPRMDGFELIKNLRANVATSSIPVVLFSHLGRAEDKARAAKIPNVYFMVKGFDGPNDILKKVEELIDGAVK